MNARAVEDAHGQLRDLRAKALENAALAFVAFGAALVATGVRPNLAVPLLLGALTTAFLAARAFVRAHLLVEELALDRDALAIPEVRAYALRAAAPARRRHAAASIRAALDASGGAVDRVEANRRRLEELEGALLDERLTFDPSSAVDLYWLALGGWDAFYGSAVPSAEVAARLLRILSGFSPRETKEAPR
jgi:hypothetical protein